MNAPRDHHFVPQFLLRRWCNSNGELTVYKRVLEDVKTFPRPTKSVGFERDLYSYARVSSEKTQVIETEFMSPKIDNPAASIIKKLIDGKISRLTSDERSDFTRFVLSLRVRHPDAVKLAQAEGEMTLRKELERASEEYLEVKSEDAPPTFLEWVERNSDSIIPNFGMSLIPSVIVDDKIGARIFSTPWSTYDAREANVDFVLGDRPCLLEGNAVDGHFLIALPISPTMLFLISSRPEWITSLSSTRPTDVVKRFNKASVLHASERIVATGTHHLPLVTKYLKKITR